MYRFFGFIFSFLIFIYIHRDLSLCASFLVRIAGGRAQRLPPAPPHPLLFFNQLPLLPTLFLFFRKHRLFGLIFYIINIFILAATTTTTSTTTSTTTTTPPTTTSSTTSTSTITSTSTSTTTTTTFFLPSFPRFRFF